MSATSLSSVDPTPFQINEYSGGTPGGAPTTGTARLDVSYLELGTTAAGDNTPAIGVTVLVDPDPNFDDSVFSKLRVWAMNIPRHDPAFDIEVEFSATATLPATDITNPLTSGVALPGNPNDAIQGTADGAASGAGDEYDPATRLIRHVILQGQAGAGAIDWQQQSSVHGAPVLMVQYPRVALDGPSLLLPNIQEPEWQEDNFYFFSSVDVFYVEMHNGRECWYQVGAVKDESVGITFSEEDVTWERGKPKIPYHKARSGMTSSFSFQLDQDSPNIWSRAHGTRASVSSSRDEVFYNIGAQSTRRPTGKWVLRWSTLGGYLKTVEMNRATIMADGEFNPGADDFAGRTFTVSALAQPGCGQKVVTRVGTSQQPIGIACVPMRWVVG
jgi:hypothetical protein